MKVVHITTERPPVTVEFDMEEADFIVEHGAQSASYTINSLARLLKKEGYGR